jgi:hypothetical protein
VASGVDGVVSAGEQARQDFSKASDTRAVSDAIGPLRGRLEEDAGKLTLALLALARADAARSAPFNAMSAQDRAALKALSRWTRDARHALQRVRKLGGAPSKHLAERWLTAQIAALDLQRQSLSVVDPTMAADLAAKAGRRIEECERLESRLDRVLS